MLSRKGSGVGERLQAALAGLQELHLLRDRQGDMVSWALRLDREEPVSSVTSEAEGAGLLLGAEEQRLEATLTSLKQQLSRLRKQDVGLKTHLQQLDQQINELKLDVNKASTEQLESDSRPSSGFYELSDGGSCSRSDSCTSVYSECLSSSQTSLIMSPSSCHVSPPPQFDSCHRRSVEESLPNPPRAAGLHLGSSRIRASATGAEHTRPRPVSTGDLDKMMAQGFGCFKSVDAKKPPMCPKQTTFLMEPRFQRSLEFHSGTEAYQYPSPLHAVAIQSPIFSHGGEAGKSVLLEGQGAPENNYDSLQMGSKTLGYIDKLLQRSLSKMQRETGTETMKSEDRYDRKFSGNVHEVSQKCVSMLLPPQVKTNNMIPPNSDQKRLCQEPTYKMNQKQALGAADGLSQHSAAFKDYRSDEVICSSLKKNDKHQGENAKAARSHSDKKCNLDPRPQGMKPNTGIVRGFDVLTGSPEFVHARFVPAGSQRVKMRQADRKTKAVKLKPKSGVKPRAVKHQHSSSGERTGAEAKGERRKAGKGKVMNRVNACQELRQSSGSESVLYSPGLKVQPKTSSVPAFTKFGRSCRLQCLEYDYPTEQRRRRQAASKWQSDMDIFQGPYVHRSKESRVKASESLQMVCSISAKSGHWMGPQQPFQFPMFSSSFLHSLNSRYPPAPAHMSGLYPPRCESEYSAECASLFHSTIAESSEGETSDNTTNRFGDSESSQSFRSYSDSDSSLSPEEGELHEEERGLVWAEASFGPTAAERPPQQLPPRPEPSTCRIKASRALKKKIRRFQPASLKVMTLV
ncbi:dapper homolog 2 [Kryptolebias marmoratus]|uniref:Dishevelled-binding antagonist of beta-catenin 2 n=1 Tax=Kryptolebias marmoratus TaxID=37003 RepID=A0A3Q3A583_KRYMA|nr:dapper homolog 2 [Kryptolebias marmoratus]